MGSAAGGRFGPSTVIGTLNVVLAPIRSAAEGPSEPGGQIPASELQLVDSPLDQYREMSGRWLEFFALVFGDLEVQLPGD